VFFMFSSQSGRCRRFFPSRTDSINRAIGGSFNKTRRLFPSPASLPVVPLVNQTLFSPPPPLCLFFSDSNGACPPLAVEGPVGGGIFSPHDRSSNEAFCKSVFLPPFNGRLRFFSSTSSPPAGLIVFFCDGDVF